MCVCARNFLSRKWDIPSPGRGWFRLRHAEESLNESGYFEDEDFLVSEVLPAQGSIVVHKLKIRLQISEYRLLNQIKSRRYSIEIVSPYAITFFYSECRWSSKNKYLLENTILTTVR